MKLKHTVVVVVTVLLITLSVGTSLINYNKSLEMTHEQLVKRSLPLSIDNIYTEIQKNIIEPNLISSMMATNTFLRDWLINEEENVDKIAKYLHTVKNKYSMFNTFLVSDKSRNYYSSKGFLEKVEEDNPNNAWYFRFRDIQNHHEINLDYNEHMGKSMIFFINYKIFDYDYQYLGATGIALKTSYINEMLSFFRSNYNFNVFFINKDGEVVLSEIGVNKLENIKNIPALKERHAAIIGGESRTFEYQSKGYDYLLNSKYIPELGLYLIVEAKLENFTKEVRNTFYLNLLLSLFVTVIIILIILFTMRFYNKQLLRLAQYDALTNLPNRRTFNENFDSALKQFERDNSNKGIILLDVDNFKNINDTYGHLTGDKVLKRIGKLLDKIIRKSDYIARWGGEEFSVLLHDANIEQTKEVAEKIRKALVNDIELQDMVHEKVSASFGLTVLKEGDSMNKAITRADDALYVAKHAGKNCYEVKL